MTIERYVVADELNPISAKAPDKFSPFALLDYIKQAKYSIPPCFDFRKTCKASGETVYRWADEEQLGSNETTVIGSTDEINREAQDITKKEIDYSLKTKSEQALLAHAWSKSGMTADEIIERLYKKEYESGCVEKESLKRKLRRLKEGFPQQ
nr:hypothetical protein [uncultured Desulfobacter sp.]